MQGQRTVDRAQAVAPVVMGMHQQQQHQQQSFVLYCNIPFIGTKVKYLLYYTIALRHWIFAAGLENGIVMTVQ